MGKMRQAVCWLVWMAVLLSLGGCSLMQAKAPPVDSAVETAASQAEGECWKAYGTAQTAKYAKKIGRAHV
jgi:hypothetical protein